MPHNHTSHKSLRRTAIISILLGLCADPVLAAEPSGCAAFKWSIDRERAVLTAPNPLPLASGTELDAAPAGALVLSLRPAAEAALPNPPERAPTPDRFSGFFRIKQMAKSGTYTIALSASGWIDAVQRGRALKPTGFSGATDCDGIRKLVRYELGAGELLLQISGVVEHSVTLAIAPAD